MTGTATRAKATLWPRRSGAAVHLAVLVLLATGPSGSGAQEAEHELKAQFVERFTRFVDWPEGSGVEDPQTPFVIGVLGDEALRTALDSLAQRVRVKGKRLEVVGLDGVADAARCQVAFLSASRRGELAPLLEVTRQRPILTVGDGSGFASQGILVNFFQEGKFLRFEVNEPAVRAAGLRISADLLAVARVVR